MNYGKMIIANTYTMSVLAFLSFAQPISAQPSQEQIAGAISAYLPAFAHLGDFEHRIFESNQPGVGRVAITGVVSFDRDIIRRTREELFAPREMSPEIRNIVFQKANIDPRSTGWRTALQAGQNIEISGNLLYEERVTDFSWEPQLSLSAPEGIVASQLPRGDYIISGDEHSRLLERIDTAINEVQDLQRDFVRYVEREILGWTFAFQNECRGYTVFVIHIDRSPKNIEVRDLTGSGNFFGSLPEIERRGLAEVVVWGDYDFSGSSAPYVPPSWAGAAGGRIAFSFNLRFQHDGHLLFELDRKVAWNTDGTISTNTNTNFIGRWAAESGFVGFRNGPSGRCANPVLVRIEQPTTGNNTEPEEGGSDTVSATGRDLVRAMRGKTWAGVMTQGNQRYRIEVDATASSIRVIYPSLPCSGVWEIVEPSDSEIIFREVIQEGRDVCVGIGFISATEQANGEISIGYSRSRDVAPSSHAVLSRD